MASIFTTEFDVPFSVRQASANAEPWQAIKVSMGGVSISLSREEAAQLAADLLNAVDATPVDAEVASA